MYTQQSDPAGTVARRTEGRVARLEHQVTRRTAAAQKLGVELQYAGIAPVFAQTYAFPGSSTDWVIGPVADGHIEYLPPEPLAAIDRLVAGGEGFPLVYVAHERRKSELSLPAGTTGPIVVDRHHLTHAATDVPAPLATEQLNQRLGDTSRQVLRVLGIAVPVVGMILAAPFVVAGAIIGGALAGLDPIIFGVVPSGRGLPGEPAAWYVIARWEW